MPVIKEQGWEGKSKGFFPILYEYRLITAYVINPDPQWSQRSRNWYSTGDFVGYSVQGLQ